MPRDVCAISDNDLTITLPSGRVVTYTRDANGDVSGVSAVVNGSGATLASSITYLPFGPMNALTYGNSLTFSATFDQDYYLTNRTVSGSIYNHTYDTDANGNITQVGSTTFNFDELNRLEEEDSGSAVNYTYDATKAEAENEIIMMLATTELGTCPRNSNGIKIGIVSPDFLIPKKGQKLSWRKKNWGAVQILKLMHPKSNHLRKRNDLVCGKRNYEHKAQKGETKQDTRL